MASAVHTPPRMVRAVLAGGLALALAGCSQLVMNGTHGGKLERGPEDCIESSIPIAVDGTLAVGAATLSVLAFRAMPDASHADTMTFDGALADTATDFARLYTVTVGLAAATLAFQLAISASRGVDWRRECRVMKRQPPNRPQRDVELDY